MSPNFNRVVTLPCKLFVTCWLTVASGSVFFASQCTLHGVLVISNQEFHAMYAKLVKIFCIYSFWRTYVVFYIFRKKTLLYVKKNICTRGLPAVAFKPQGPEGQWSGPGRVACCPWLSNDEYADGTDGRTDGRTDARPLHYAVRQTRPA